jgi:hypothetical protein
VKTGKASLLQSGIIFSAANLLTSIGNYAFQAFFSRHLGNSGEYGLANSAIVFMGLLGLPLSIASFAITHYIARFDFAGDEARLHSLLAGCRKFLFRLTIGGSVFVVLLVKPLSDFFHFPRISLLLVVLVCVCAGLWATFATALCQGKGWFGRLAFINFLAMSLRLTFGGLITVKIPTAEMVVLAYGVGLLANLVLLFWKEDLVRPDRHPESPWNREFIQFLIVSAACVIGSFCFMQGDLLVAKRFFSNTELDAYSAAGLLARALPMAVAPLLIVLFTHRSGKSSGDSAWEQLKLLGLYATGLVGGAVSLLWLHNLFLKIIARNTPAAAEMITPLAITMVFVGLLQALALWGLASRWLKISLLYGTLGFSYWLVLLGAGKTPTALLQTMPVAAGIAFGILFFVWLLTMKQSKPDTQN